MILFELLKIFGYILLIFALVFLMLLLLILFIPVFYRFNINSDNGFVMKGKIKILFGLISADIISDTEEKFVIKILGVPLKSVNSDNDTDNSIDEGLREEEQLFNMSVQLNNIDANNSQRKNSVQEDNCLSGKFKKLIKKIKEFINNIIFFVKNIISKIERIYEFITDENVITAITDHKSRIFKILSHLGPKKSDLVIRFGFDDPSAVGYVLALAAPFYALYEKWITLEPNFDERVFSIKGDVKGRAYIYYLLWHFIRVYFNKNVKNIRRKYKTSM